MRKTHIRESLNDSIKRKTYNKKSTRLIYSTTLNQYTKNSLLGDNSLR